MEAAETTTRRKCEAIMQDRVVVGPGLNAKGSVCLRGGAGVGSPGNTDAVVRQSMGR